MLFGLLVLLVCQLAGEVLSYALPVTVPGPVLGMVLMFVCLMVGDRLKGSGAVEGNAEITGSGDFILKNMSLLFVPAGVGVVQKSDLLAAHGLGLIVTVVASTIITLVATVGAFLAASAAMGRYAERNARRD